MATRFDYKAACREVAMPAVATLPASVLSLYCTLRDDPKYDGMRQGENLDIHMPEELRPQFDALDSATLALASKALHDFGHWGGIIDSSALDTRGATWKFANLADQVLSARCNISRRESRGSHNGYTLTVIDGVVRLCLGTPNLWTWREVGPATEDFVVELRERMMKLPEYFTSRRVEDKLSDALNATADHMRPWLSEQWARMLSVGETYMREEGKCLDDCPECGKQELWGNPQLDHAKTCSRYPRAEVAAGSFVKEAQKLLEALGPEDQIPTDPPPLQCLLRTVLERIEKQFPKGV